MQIFADVLGPEHQVTRGFGIYKFCLDDAIDDFLSAQMEELLSNYAIGLDVGATKIAGGIVNLSVGKILYRLRVATLPKRGGRAVLDDTLKVARDLMDEAVKNGWEITGIGVGVPELVDLKGNVTSENAIAWRNMPLQEIFSAIAPTMVESDVRAAALAEARYGAGAGFNIVLYVTVGSGISSCLVLHGKPYAGAQGNALILASSPLTTVCTRCGTLLNPVLEEFAAGPALGARYSKIYPSAPSTGEAVFEAALAGDANAVQIVTSAGEALGTSVGFAVNLLDPEVIVVGGGLGSADGLYWDHFVRSTREHVWSETNRDLPLLHAALGAEAGVIGAAAMFRSTMD